MKKTLAVLIACSLAATACGGSEGDDMEGMPMAEIMHTVSITAPADGSTVTGPRVTVQIATNVPIVQAGDMTPGTGHHHLFLDGDLSPSGVPIPSVPGAVVHMGNGASEFTFDAVSPGRHRLITVVADGAHVPLVPAVVDTIFFTVQ